MSNSRQHARLTYRLADRTHLTNLFDHVNRHLTLMERQEEFLDSGSSGTRVELPPVKIKSKKEYLDQFLTHQPVAVTTSLIGGINCPICLQCYLPGEFYRELNTCGHKFHQGCVDQWLDLNRDEFSCPLCRSDQYNK